jgi:hypothetical protein
MQYSYSLNRKDNRWEVYKWTSDVDAITPDEVPTLIKSYSTHNRAWRKAVYMNYADTGRLDLDAPKRLDISIVTKVIFL